MPNASSLITSFANLTRSWLHRVILITALFALNLSWAGEWITLQVPLSRSSHSFELWEVNQGSYVQTPASAPSLYNGYFDGHGNWRPLPSSYARVQVERQDSGAFWLKDLTTGEFGPADQMGLVNAEWRDSNGQTTLRYFVIPEELYDHSFVVQYPGGQTFNVTTGQIQGAYNDDNQFVSFGYFEAWAERLTGSDAGWRLIDCHLGKQGPVEAENLVGAQWTAFSGTLPWHQVTFIWSDTTGHGAEIHYTLYVQGGAGQSGTSWFDPITNTSRFSGSVPQGVKYWLVRDQDQARSEDYVMLNANLQQDLSSSLPVPPPSNYTSVDFYVYGYDPYDPAGLFVEYLDAAGGSVGISIQSVFPIYYWGEDGNQLSEYFFQGSATIDVSRPWSVISPTDGQLGQSMPIFSSDWPTGNWYAPAGTIGVTFAGVRASHPMKLYDMDVWQYWNFTEQSSGTMGGNFGPNGEYVSWPVSFRSAPAPANPGYHFLYDVTLGDSLFGTVGDNWFISQNLALKISATRFGHDLRIRTGNGQEFSVTPHNIQGVWTTTQSGYPSFESFGYFDASANTYSDLPWWLLDYTRLTGGNPEVLSADPNAATDFSGDIDTTDTDNDGWQDWYERLVGTNINAVDTDGDGINDPQDPNPRALAANTSSSTLKIFTPLE